MKIFNQRCVNHNKIHFYSNHSLKTVLDHELDNNLERFMYPGAQERVDNYVYL